MERFRVRHFDGKTIVREELEMMQHAEVVRGAQPVPGRMLAATGRRQGLHMVEERPTGIHRVA